ncbi:MAG: hypothetical protein WBA12_10945 [Catalinimonas sp.]
MNERQTTLLTRRMPLHFDGDQALTPIDTDVLRQEIESKYSLLSDRPVSVSVQSEYLYVTFLVQEKRERNQIGFR